MKRFILFIQVAVYCYAVIFAQQKSMLLGVSNSLCIGDSIRYDLVDIGNIRGISLYEPFWDFSNLKYLGPEKDVCFIDGKGGEVRMIGQDEMLDFKQTTDGLWLSQIQTALLKIDFGDTFSYLRYPFGNKDSLVCSIEGQGIYCSKNKFRLEGKCEAKAIGTGKIILPDNESLSHTLLVKRSVVGNIIPSVDSADMMPNVDKLQLGVDAYVWYSQGYRYPVFKVLQASLKNGNREILQRKYACVANMDSFEKLEDAENEKLRISQQGEDGEAQKSSSLIDYQVSMSGKHLNLSYSLSSDSQLRFVLSNTSGMLLKSVGLHQPVGNGYRQVIDLGNLPRGEYVLYINVNDQKFSEKVSIEN